MKTAVGDVTPVALPQLFGCEVARPDSVATETRGAQAHLLAMVTAKKELGFFVRPEQMTLNQRDRSWAIEAANILWRRLTIVPLVGLRGRGRVKQEV